MKTKLMTFAHRKGLRRRSCITIALFLTVVCAPLIRAQDPPVESGSAPLNTAISAESFGRAAMLDSIYGAWMRPDDRGQRDYWFRKTFDLTEHPSGGRVWITADDNYDLFINGSYVFQDGRDSLDWMQVDKIEIGSYLKIGRNAIAVHAYDMDSTRLGIKVGVVYETIPDIESELDKMVEREMFSQTQRLEEARMAEEAQQPETVDEAGQASEEGGLSAKQIQEIRIIKKNKLY